MTDNSQHGFNKVEYNLIAFYDELSSSIRGKGVDVAYFDFSKAFDSLPWSPCSQIGGTRFK